jgi:integrase
LTAFRDSDVRSSNRGGDMSVHQLPDGRWCVQYKSDGRLKREYFGRGPESERQARQRNTGLPLRSWQRRTPEPGGVWFADLAQAYLDAMAANLQEDSRRNLVWKLNSVIIPQIGKRRAIQITPEVIDQYVKTRLATGRTLKDKSVRYPKRTTIHRELSDISAILNWAVERRYITHNPISKYRKPKRDDEVIQPPTQAEISALLAVAPSWLVRALCLSYYTGIRPGRAELLRRKWADVNWFGTLGSLVQIQSSRPLIYLKLKLIFNGILRSVPTFQDFFLWFN